MLSSHSSHSEIKLLTTDEIDIVLYVLLPHAGIHRFMTNQLLTSMLGILTWISAGMQSFKRAQSWFFSISWCKCWGQPLSFHALYYNIYWKYFIFFLCHRATYRILTSKSFVIVSFFLQVDPFSSVSAAHDIGENVRHEIQQSHPEIAEVFVHIGKHFFLLMSDFSIVERYKVLHL